MLIKAKTYPHCAAGAFSRSLALLFTWDPPIQKYIGLKDAFFLFPSLCIDIYPYTTAA